MSQERGSYTAKPLATLEGNPPPHCGVRTGSYYYILVSRMSYSLAVFFGSGWSSLSNYCPDVPLSTSMKDFGSGPGVEAVDSLLLVGGEVAWKYVDGVHLDATKAYPNSSSAAADSVAVWALCTSPYFFLSWVLRVAFPFLIIALSIAVCCRIVQLESFWRSRLSLLAVCAVSRDVLGFLSVKASRLAWSLRSCHCHSSAG